MGSGDTAVEWRCGGKDSYEQSPHRSSARSSRTRRARESRLHPQHYDGIFGTRKYKRNRHCLRKDRAAKRIRTEVLMKCPSCQNLLADDAQFCGTCGLPTSRHPSDAATQINEPRITNSPRDDPRVGLILDSKYKLIESLGQGGMGSVFRAERLHIGDEVAVKLLHPDLVREKQALERFRREARTAAVIRHPNVVSTHDFNDGTGETREAYIVMELVQGVSLGTLLRREGRMSPQRAAR